MEESMLTEFYPKPSRSLVPRDDSSIEHKKQISTVEQVLSIMKISLGHNYYVYLVTNKNKTVLYTGITCDLNRRLTEYKENSIPFRHHSFAGQYNASFLLYYEHFQNVDQAIAREKEIKGWRRSKNEALINTLNPDWDFLNDEISLSS
jgi:putative endonuclease